MKILNLDKKWKVWIYRLGIIMNCVSILGLILIAINANLNWGEDIWKSKKNPKFNGNLERFFYLFGWVGVIGLCFSLILNLF